MKRWLRSWRQQKAKQAASSNIESRWALAGYAILCADESTGQPYWHTYGEDGMDECKLSLRQPVVFPTKKLPMNSIIRVYIPRGSDEQNQ